MPDQTENENSQHIGLTVSRKFPSPWPGPSHLLERAARPPVCFPMLLSLPIMPPQLCLAKSLTFLKPWRSPLQEASPTCQVGNCYHASLTVQGRQTVKSHRGQIPQVTYAPHAFLSGRGCSLINSIPSKSAWPGEDAVSICGTLKGAGESILDFQKWPSTLHRRMRIKARKCLRSFMTKGLPPTDTSTDGNQCNINIWRLHDPRILRLPWPLEIRNTLTPRGAKPEPSHAAKRASATTSRGTHVPEQQRWI